MTGTGQGSEVIVHVLAVLCGVLVASYAAVLRPRLARSLVRAETRRIGERFEAGLTGVSGTAEDPYVRGFREVLALADRDPRSAVSLIRGAGAEPGAGGDATGAPLPTADLRCVQSHWSDLGSALSRFAAGDSAWGPLRRLAGGESPGPSMTILPAILPAPGRPSAGSHADRGNLPLNQPG